MFPVHFRRPELKLGPTYGTHARYVPYVFVGLIGLLSARLWAHDMWIEPTAFRPQLGAVLGLKLRVGQDFLGDPLPRDPELIERFVSVDASGEKPVIGRDGGDPAGLMRLETPGLTIVGYRSRPSHVTLPAEKFNQYLREEGLESIAALRDATHQTQAEAREMFSRCAKSLVAVGPSAAQADRSLGMTLELVAERNPYALSAGQELPVRLIYQNRPLAGALVIAINRAAPTNKLSARSDSNGRVRFDLPQAGTWLIKAVHMIPAPHGSDAEWVSYWASLTFDLQARP